MASLLLCLCTVETIVRVPVANHAAIQFRDGALPLLDKLSEHQKRGELEVSLLTTHSELHGHAYFSTVLKKYPAFQLQCDAAGVAGRIIVERHWRERALELRRQSTLRILVVGSRKSVGPLWRLEECVAVEPFMALTQDQRRAKKARDPEAYRLGLAQGDATCKGIYRLVADVMSMPTTPVSDVLKTSAAVEVVNFPMMGNAFYISPSAARDQK